MAESDNPDFLPTQACSTPDNAAPAPSPRLTDSVLEGMLGAHSPPRRIAWQPPTPEELQARLPQYEIKELLGHGGMGAVYKGWQRSLDRFVAIKILPPDLTGDDTDFAARFQREAKAMARLKHPGIIPVHDAGETPDGLLYFVMDYVDGTDVQKLVAAQERLSVEQALTITTHVLDALAYAHEHGIIHRDIKPANIMLDNEGRVLVADFGLARNTLGDSVLLTGTHVAMGTPDFMAPESRLGASHADHRADLYAVGVMLYRMITGKLPHGRFEIPSRVVPGLDKRLDRIVDRTLQTERDARYSSAIALRADLEPILTRTIARRVTATSGTSSSRTKPVFFVIAASLVLAAIIHFAPWKKSEAGGTRSVVSQTSAVAVAAPGPSPAWEQNVFAAMDRKEALRDKPNAEMQGIYLHLWSDEAWTVLGPGHRDVAIRTVIVWDGKMRNVKLIAREDGNRAYFARLLTDAVEIGIQEGSDRNLKKFPFTPSWKEGDEISFQFAGMGNQLAAWVNGQFIGSVADSTIQSMGKTRVSAGEGRFKSVDLLNLDGLPEAEALKLAGVSAGTLAYPAGNWVKVWPQLQSLPEGPPRESFHLNTFRERDGWIEGLTKNGGDVFDIRAVGRDAMVRATFRYGADANHFSQVAVRSTGRGPWTHYILRLASDGAGAKLLLHDDKVADSSREKTLGEKPFAKALALGDAYTLELAAIGRRLVARCNGQLIADIKDPQIAEGMPGIRTGEPFRDFEMMNLDGLSEAEALKLAGVDAASASPSPSPQVSASAPVAATKDAPTGVLTFGGHRYQFVPGAFTWTEAKAKAESLGGHLATLTSKEEAEWAKKIYLTRENTALWLGGYRTPDNKWHWVTGEPWTFADWARWKDGGGEPGDHTFGPGSTPADCLELLWHDTYVPPGGWDDTRDKQTFPASYQNGMLVEWENSEDKRL